MTDCKTIRADELPAQGHEALEQACRLEAQAQRRKVAAA